MSQPRAAARCPLCGGPNACALADAEAPAGVPCWCASQRFDAALLARVPQAAAGRACICRRCAQAAGGASGTR